MREILFITAIAIIFGACQSKTEHTISGIVADHAFEGQQVRLIKEINKELTTIDSTTIVDGKFEFKGDEKSPVLRTMAIGEIDSKIRTKIVLEPGIINVKYDSAFHITGSALNDDYGEFNKERTKLAMDVLKYSIQLNAATKDEATDNLEQQQKIAIGLHEALEGTKEINYNYAFNNINNEIGQEVFLKNAKLFSPEQKKEILAKASKEFKNREETKSIVDEVKAFDAVAIGADFIDFTMKNPEGETVSLSDYAGKGKYVFIDFWASWCGPCINELPNIVEAYDKYKDKGFEVIGVSLDENKESWIKSIEDLNMTWPQMSDLAGFETEAAKLYVVTGIPHTILLDKEGKILAKNLRGEKLHEKLAEIFD